MTDRFASSAVSRPVAGVFQKGGSYPFVSVTKNASLDRSIIVSFLILYYAKS